MSQNRSVSAAGRVFKYGNDIDTDRIIPARYLNTSDPAELARYCLEDEDPSFASRVKPGDFIVAGKNFGCGSSREHAPISIKAAGITAVIAPTFARIFYRNAINTGLPILESPVAAESIRDGDEIQVDLSRGVIHNLTKKEEYQATSFPRFMQDLIAAGGLIEYTRAQIRGASAKGGAR